MNEAKKKIIFSHRAGSKPEVNIPKYDPFDDNCTGCTDTAPEHISKREDYISAFNDLFNCSTFIDSAISASILADATADIVERDNCIFASFHIPEGSINRALIAHFCYLVDFSSKVNVFPSADFAKNICVEFVYNIPKDFFSGIDDTEEDSIPFEYMDTVAFGCGKTFCCKICSDAYSTPEEANDCFWGHPEADILRWVSQELVVHRHIYPDKDGSLPLKYDFIDKINDRYRLIDWMDTDCEEPTL